MAILHERTAGTNRELLAGQAGGAKVNGQLGIRFLGTFCTHSFYVRRRCGGYHEKDVMAPMNNEPLAAAWGCGNLPQKPPVGVRPKGNAMVWTTPILVEICIGLEINGYLPAEF